MGQDDSSGRGSRAVTRAKPSIDIVGLGPAGVEYVTQHTLDIIASHDNRFVRTMQHPSAHVVLPARSLDHHYENAATFDDVYRDIVAELITAAMTSGRILYAVPGSPLILERTVRLLLEDDRVVCHVHPAMSFLDIAWSRLGIDPIEQGVRLIDAHDFARAAAGDSGAMLLAHCHANWVLSDIKLAAEDTIDSSNDEVDVVILHHLGLDDETITRVRWSDLDRSVDADHLTSVFVPGLAAPVGREMIAFHELVHRLRRECPWDKEQTHQSLTTYILEETYEVIDALQALDESDPSTDEALIEELGDLLYQIEFHAAIGEQQGRFTMGDIARGIHDKMIRRHPHVFGDPQTPATHESLASSWETIKKAEKRARGIPDGPFDGLIEATGSLAYATSIAKRAEKAGAPISTSGPDTDFIAQIEDLGMHLLHIVVECRRRSLDPELVLRTTARDVRAAIEERDLGFETDTDEDPSGAGGVEDTGH